MAVSCLHHASCRMSRDQRVQDNWAFLHAAEVASKTKSPVAVVFNLVGPISAWHVCTMLACDHLHDLPAFTGRCHHLIGHPTKLSPLYTLICHIVAIDRAHHGWTSAPFLRAVWLPFIWKHTNLIGQSACARISHGWRATSPLLILELMAPGWGLLVCLAICLT